jgi:hypothetical protein
MSSNHRLGWIVGLALVVAVVSSGTAIAGGQTPQALYSDSASYARKYLQNRPAASFYTPQALKAEGMRWQAIARAYGGRQTRVVSTSAGFDWGDAGIGAVGSLGAGIGAVALVLGARRLRRARLAL